MRLRGERGYTLVELLTVISLMSVVIGATVSAFVTMTRSEATGRKQNEAQDQARLTTQRLAAELRNLASPLDRQPNSIDEADGFDIVFQTVDGSQTAAAANARNVMRVRYCLSPSDGDSEVLWMQVQRWNSPTVPVSPSTASCPGGGWGNQQPVVENVVNREQSLPVFTYVPGSTDLPGIRGVKTQLFVDVNPGRQPEAVRLATGVFLRNQNRAPVASCTATYAGNGQVLLNGSASEDPEGHNLRSYQWFESSGGSSVAEGVVARVTPGSGAFSYRLDVRDTGGLIGTAACDQGVTVP
jgi:prepilin-type N-terminal cleavage/methylation domain-containing protein